MNKSAVPLDVKPNGFIPVMSHEITKMGNKFIFVCAVDATKIDEETTNFNITHYTFVPPELLKEIQEKYGVIGMRSYLYNMYERLKLQMEGKA